MVENMKKKPSVVGFKPSDDEWLKVCELVEHFEKKQVIGSVTVTDVMKIALLDLHAKHVSNPKNRYGVN